MRQSLEMLQKTSVELRAELQAQMAQNPVIEEVSSRLESPLTEAFPEEHANASREGELDFTPTGSAAESTLGADDGYRDYFLQNMENFHASEENGAADSEAQTRRQRLFDMQVEKETLQEHLLAQIPLSDIPPEDRVLAEELIGHINDNGLFDGSLPDIEMVYGAKEEHVLRLLRKIQTFDPIGCGGRDFRECMLAQMEKLDDSPWEDEVRKLLSRHEYWLDMASHREGRLCHMLGIMPEDYPKVIAELTKLDPKPGRGFVQKPNESIYVRPEVFLMRTPRGEWRAKVSSRDLPQLRISKRYLSMLEDPGCPAETKSFIREKVRAAEALVEAIDDRQETIQNIAQAIVDVQGEVFRRGLSALKPLTMEQIAQKVGVHNTTVSRTVRDKYISTPVGVIELRRFFTSGVTTESGESISNTSVQGMIQEIVATEDKRKPFSDERIAEILKTRGVAVARRTVAKYREIIGIPGTAARKIK